MPLWMIRRYWFLFFFISGFCSLLYEVVWLRLAMASYGVTTPLVSIVLSIFMGGLALGSWGAGELMERLADQPAAVGLRLYGAAEAVTALSATAVPWLFRWGREVLVTHGNDWGSGSYYLASAGFVLIAVLPFSTCMGATFPLGLFVLRKSDSAQGARGFSYLYVANVAGAILGTLVTAFALVELLGFSETLAIAAAGNAILAVCALGLSLLRPPTPAMAGEPKADAAAGVVSERPAALPVLATLFLTGLVSMGMEVVWIRELTPYLGSLVYGFASILALYLLATFTGSALYRRGRVRRPTDGIPPPLWGMLAVASLIPLVMADPRLPLGDFYNLRISYHFLSFGLLRAALAVLPFATTLGFITPMLMDLWSAGDPRRAGTAYGFNIVGCILGPLVAGFLLLPSLGERGALVALAAPLLLGALLAPIGAAAGARRHRSAVAVIAVCAAAMGVVTLLTRGYETAYTDPVIRRDFTATVAAVGNDRDTKVIIVNGVGMTRLTPITKMMAHLPLAFRPKPPRHALIICFGMGTTYRSALSWGIETTAVELIPSVPGLMWYFHADGNALLHSPRGHIVIDDGRRFLERSSQLFDAVIIDPPPPLEAAGSSLLYSREFYEAAKRRMTPDGILQQWIPYGDTIVASAFLKAVMATFPHVRTFGSIEGWGVHILASAQPIPNASAQELADRLPPEAARDLVEWGPFARPVDQYAGVLEHEFPPQGLVGLYPDAPVLVDDRPLNEYFFVRRQLAAWRAPAIAPRP
jgi:spermidine synthase